MAAGHRRRLCRAQRGGLAGSGAWCPRRQRRRMPRRRAPRFYSRAVSSSWPRLPALPCRCILQPGGGRYPNYRPGWTVFHLPSTLWAAEAEHRPFRIQRTGHTRFRLQGLFPLPAPPRRGRDPAALPRLTGLRGAPTLACTSQSSIQSSILRLDALCSCS